MNQSLFATKHDGRKERIDLDKIHRVIDWAAEGLKTYLFRKLKYVPGFSFTMGYVLRTSTKP